MAEKHDTVRGLVLAGGGAKGSYQVGVYQALMELGWLPDVITGASVGSLNAALFVMGKVNEAADLWRSLDNHGVLELPEGKTPEELRDFLLETLRGGGLNTEPLGQTIDQYMDENAIRASHIKYGLVITEMNTLRSVQCTLDDIPQGQLKDYMLASSACFPALRPYEIDGVKYIDGGWRDNMPLELAAKMGATELIGVDVDGVGLTRPNLTGLLPASSAAIGTWGRCLILTVCVPPKTLPWVIWIPCGNLAAWAVRRMAFCPMKTALCRTLPLNTRPS